MTSKFDNGQWTLFPAGAGGRSNQQTHDIVDAGGSLWLAHCCCTSQTISDTLCGAERVQDEGSDFERLPSVLDAWKLSADDQGYVWAATQNDEATRRHGLYRINVATGQVDNYTHENQPNLVSDNLSSVLVVGRVVWIGYARDGLSAWDLGPDRQPSADDSWVHYTQGPLDYNMLSSSVTCLGVGGDGTIWVGSDLGISILNESGAFDNHGAEVLPSSYVNAVVPTTDGGAWVATAHGSLTRMTPKSTGGFDYQTFGPPNLPNPNVEDIAFGPDGRTLWLATDRGVASFQPPVTSAAAVGQVGVYPNPFKMNCSKDTALRLIGAGGRASGVVIDLSGKIVGRFQDRAPEDPIWDGRIGSQNGSGGGARVTPGLYWIRASSPTGVHSVGVAMMDADCEH